MRPMTLINLLISIAFALSQTAFKLDNAKSKMTIDGTSTLHDWTSVIEVMSGNANIIKTDSSLQISSLKFQVLVTSIKSGKEGMDENTWEELKYEDHPNIQYELLSVDKISPTATGYSLETKGALQVVGKTQINKITVKASIQGDQIKFSGEKALKMTDFDIDPPTMFLGTITTGDDITIKFNVIFNKEN